MAKRGAKSAAIKEFIANHPTAKAREILDALKAQKIKVSPNQVYALLSKSNGKPTAKKSSKAPASDSNVESLFHVKTLVTAVGSIDQARQALDTYAKLLA